MIKTYKKYIVATPDKKYFWVRLNFSFKLSDPLNKTPTYILANSSISKDIRDAELLSFKQARAIVARLKRDKVIMPTNINELKLFPITLVYEL